MKFFDRKEAGALLAKALSKYKQQANTLVLALPRGGVPVAEEIAKSLSLPLDLLIVRKIGSPHHLEFAIGAIASGDVLVWNEQVLPYINTKDPAIQAQINAEYKELKRREQDYRGGLPYPSLKQKIVILVDDGIATGTTAKAAINAIRHLGALQIILAVPVAARDSIQLLSPLVDKIICLLQPENFEAVGLWYTHFEQVSDTEVISIMKKFISSETNLF